MEAIDGNRLLKFPRGRARLPSCLVRIQKNDLLTA